MEKIRLHILRILVLSLSILAVNAFAAKAGDGIYEKGAFGEYERKIELYNEKLNELELKANNITPAVATEAYALFMTGLALNEELLTIKSLEPEDHGKLFSYLGSKMANTFFKLMRHNGDLANPDGKVNFPTKLGRGALEMWDDLTRMFGFYFRIRIKTFEAKLRKANPLEAMRRERLVRSLQTEMQKATQTQLPAIESFDDIFKEKYFGIRHYLVDRAINIRMERDASQKFARIMYFILGMTIFVYPPDLSFGQEFIEYYDYTNTAIKGFIGFATLWFLKGLTSSRKSTKGWIRFYDMLLKNEGADIRDRIRGVLSKAYPREYFVPTIDWAIRMEMAVGEKIRSLPFVITFLEKLAEVKSKLTGSKRSEDAPKAQSRGRSNIPYALCVKYFGV